MKKLYLDNAATTFVKKEVFDSMVPYLTSDCFNASSIYDGGQEANATLQAARESIAKSINAKPSEIFFTSCGTESDNWAIVGTARKLNKKGKHIISTNIEHHAVLNTLEYLKSEGYDITFLPVDEDGLVSAEQVKNAIRPDTILVTIMHANNEIGTIEPIREIGAVCREKGVYFHTDAVQSYTHIPIDVEKDNIDMLSVSAHKFNAPKGIGFLYKKTGVNIENLIFGGQQEKGARPGTENIAFIVGMDTAQKINIAKMDEHNNIEKKIRDHMINRILKEIPYTRLNGDKEKRLPNNVNVSVQFIEGESLLLSLEAKGIMASSGSACTSGSLDPSHVLLAIGLPHEIAHGSLRFTLNEDITIEDADYVVDSLKEIVENLRSMSPLWQDFVKQNK